AELWCLRLGQVPYGEAREAQRRLEAARQRGDVPDLLLLLEHPPVYTKGKRSEPGELGMGEDWYRMQGIEVTETDRGGRVTYHGPGQLVGYPIVSLRDLAPEAEGAEMGVVDYIRRMERVMIGSLGDFGVEAEVIDGLTGVWVGGRPPEGRKIGSIGIHVNRGVTTHGFAVNVNNDLQPFEWIVPCGLEGIRMTSLCRELGASLDMSAYMDAVTARFATLYERAPAAIEAGALAERVEGLDALAAAGPAAAHLHGNGTPASVR
ncbi:MAG: lipoyl(octanoyl) transferase LipB, partial [Solirubrobacterales bacterium]